MAGYWWLKAKTYLRDRTLPAWVNQDACVPAESALRYEDKYAGADRALPLQARPLFNLDHRERRLLDLRSMSTRLSDDLDGFFLLSPELATLIQSVDPSCLHLAESDISSHGRAPHGVCFMADAIKCVEGWSALDRARSAIALRPGFHHQDGSRVHAIDINGPVYFKPEIVGESALFRVTIGWMGSRICVSDALAEAIFAQELLGLELLDASSDRKAPERYEQYKLAGWEGAYPA